MPKDGKPSKKGRGGGVGSISGVATSSLEDNNWLLAASGQPTMAAGGGGSSTRRPAGKAALPASADCGNVRRCRLLVCFVRLHHLAFCLRVSASALLLQYM